MKNCTKCGENKEDSAFSFRKDSQKLNGLCRECVAENKKRDYRKNKQAYLDRSHRSLRKCRKKLREFLIGVKQVPCTDCGKCYPYYVMDFDHVDEKQASISQLVSNGAMKKLVEELKKCEIVCANCHRERTHNRNQYTS